MRIWHEELIPKLCRQHLLAMWREGLACASILVNDKKGYRNHPAFKEFELAPQSLLARLLEVYDQSLVRGYNFDVSRLDQLKKYCQKYIDIKHEPWQTLDEQIAVLRSKGCECQV